MHHDMGLVGAVIQSLAGGMTLRLMDPALFLRAPGVWLRALGCQGATVTYAPSFGYSWLARRLTPAMLEGVDLSGWRYAVVGAERLSARPFGELAAGLAGHGFAPCLMASYGMAENTLAVSTRDPHRPLPMIALTRDEDGSGTRVARETTWEAALAASQARDDWLLSSGKPLRGMSVEIRDPDGALLPSGRIGEIHLQSPTVALPGVEDGEPPTRLATGDAGLLWNGQLYVLGRMGDSAKVNGITVYAEEVETALAAVLPRSVAWHTVLLGGVEELTAVVVAEGRGWREGADWAPEVRAIVQAALGEGVAVQVYAAPPGAVPRTSSGKPRRRQAWLLWAAGRLKGRSADDMPERTGADARKDEDCERLA
jgi:acyl-CoA synthetase (AMP-forming)/AMP-acid ligase II